LVELNKHKEHPVSEAEARKMASSLGCETYIESSAVTQKNLKEVFDEVASL
jgi:Ras homolog gene family, member U